MDLGRTAALRGDQQGEIGSQLQPLARLDGGEEGMHLGHRVVQDAGEGVAVFDEALEKRAVSPHIFENAEEARKDLGLMQQSGG